MSFLRPYKMGVGRMNFWIVVGVCVFVLFIIISIYNKLVTLRNRYKNAFAQIDVQLKRRYELIPNLVESVKKIMAHERETLEAVINARNGAASANQIAAQDPGDPTRMQGLLGAEAQLTGALGKFFALSESYPDIKTSTNMESFQEELSSTENKIAFARQAFNDAITLYNTAIEVFPNSLIAGFFNFKPGILFEVESPEERKAVKVKF